MKLTAVIDETIRLAQAIPWEKLLDSGDPPYQAWVGPELPIEAPPTPEGERLRAFLTSRPVAEVYAVIVMMFLGLGHMDIADFDFPQLYWWAGERYRKPDDALDTLLNSPALGYYLDAGLARAAAAGIDVDRLLEE